MWFPNEEMDVNKFKMVHIPPKSHYLQQFGFTTAPKSMYTGDDFAPMPKDKVASIADMEAYDAYMQKVELENESKPDNDS